jgi:hypothetical protein
MRSLYLNLFINDTRVAKIKRRIDKEKDFIKTS